MRVSDGQRTLSHYRQPSYYEENRRQTKENSTTKKSSRHFQTTESEEASHAVINRLTKRAINEHRYINDLHGAKTQATSEFSYVASDKLKHAATSEKINIARRRALNIQQKDTRKKHTISNSPRYDFKKNTMQDHRPKRKISPYTTTKNDGQTFDRRNIDKLSNPLFDGAHQVTHLISQLKVLPQTDFKNEHKLTAADAVRMHQEIKNMRKVFNKGNIVLATDSDVTGLYSGLPSLDKINSELSGIKVLHVPPHSLGLKNERIFERQEKKFREKASPAIDTHSDSIHGNVDNVDINKASDVTINGILSNTYPLQNLFSNKNLDNNNSSMFVYSIPTELTDESNSIYWRYKDVKKEETTLRQVRQYDYSVPLNSDRRDTTQPIPAALDHPNNMNQDNEYIRPSDHGINGQERFLPILFQENDTFRVINNFVLKPVKQMKIIKPTLSLEETHNSRHNRKGYKSGIIAKNLLYSRSPDNPVSLQYIPHFYDTNIDTPVYLNKSISEENMARRRHRYRRHYSRSTLFDRGMSSYNFSYSTKVNYSSPIASNHERIDGLVRQSNITNAPESYAPFEKRNVSLKVSVTSKPTFIHDLRQNLQDTNIARDRNSISHRFKPSEAHRFKPSEAHRRLHPPDRNLNLTNDSPATFGPKRSILMNQLGIKLDSGGCLDSSSGTLYPQDGKTDSFNLFDEYQRLLLLLELEKGVRRSIHVVETELTIIVKDINDNAPMFPNQTMFGEVQENGPIGKSVRNNSETYPYGCPILGCAAQLPNKYC